MSDHPLLRTFLQALRRKGSYSPTPDGTQIVAIFKADGSKLLGYATIAELQNHGITPGTVLASRALVVDANKDLASLRDVTLRNGTLTGTLGVTGIITPTGGIVPYPGSASAFRQYLSYTGGTKASASTDGTDATPSVTETYLALLYVPVNCTVTGASIFNGSATGSGNITVYLALASSTTAAVASTASTAVSGTDAYQRIAFTGGPIAVKGPAAFFLLTQYNNTATRFNTHIFGDFPAGKLTGTTYGTYPASFTAPTTFTTGLGPIASLY